MQVGYRAGVIHDAARSDWDGSGPRPVSWSAWYPAAPGVPDTALSAGGPQGTWFRPASVARDAPMDQAQGACPTVLLSHGTGGTALAMGWLAHRLARRGFIALAPNHHGNTAVEPYRAEGFLCWWERARDVTVLLDRLAADGFFAGRLDLDRVFTAGFSLGGHTSLALVGAITDMARYGAWAGDGPFSRGPRNFPDLASRIPDLMANSATFRASWTRHAASCRDTRVRAALLLAPAPPVRAFTDASLATLLVPVHIVSGGADRDAPVEIGGAWLNERLPRCTLDIVSTRGGHALFLPEATEIGRRDAPDLCRDPHSVDRGAVHATVAQAAATLFRP